MSDLSSTGIDISREEGGTPDLRSIVYSGNTKGGSITVLLTSCLTGLELAV
jgi:hypothetical protein